MGLDGWDGIKKNEMGRDKKNEMGRERMDRKKQKKWNGIGKKPRNDEIAQTKKNRHDENK